MKLLLSEKPMTLQMVSDVTWKKNIPADFHQYEAIGIVGNDMWKAMGFTDFSKYKGKVYQEKYVAIPMVTNQTNSQARQDEAIRLFDSLGRRHEIDFTISQTEEELQIVLDHIKKADVIAIDTETTGLNPFDEGSKIISLGLCIDDTCYTMPYGHPEAEPRLELICDIYQALVDFEGVLIGHNAKFDKCFISVVEDYNIPFNFDTMLASAILDENKGSHGLKSLCVSELNGIAYDIATDAKTGHGDIKSHCQYLAYDIYYTYHLWKKYSRELEDLPFENFIFENITMPATDLYYRAFIDGVFLNQKTLEEAAIQVLNTVEKKKLELSVLSKDTNWNSTKQVGELFRGEGIHSPLVTNKGVEWFEDTLIMFGVKPQTASKLARQCRNSREFIVDTMADLFEIYNEHDYRKELTKREYSVKDNPWIDQFESYSKAALQEMSSDNPLCTTLNELKKAQKYLSTFIGPWVEIQQNSYIRPSFRITGTVTGRPSCSEPNLQQVPRDPLIRSIVDAEPGWELLDIDLSQAELRIAAIMSADGELIKAYDPDSPIDVHSKTVNSLFNIPVDKMTKEERKKGKAVNFGFLYGMRERKFKDYAKDSYQTIFTEAECKKIRAGFFSLYRQLEPWHQEQIDLVTEFGEIWSPVGRTRHLPKAFSKDWREKAEAQRQAINSPVQGFAADIILSAAIQTIKEFNSDVIRVVGTVHDSFMLRVKKGRVNEVAQRVLYLLSNPPIVDKFVQTFDHHTTDPYFSRFYRDGKLTVGLVAECAVGPWGKPHSEIILGEDYEESKR